MGLPLGKGVSRRAGIARDWPQRAAQGLDSARFRFASSPVHCCLSREGFSCVMHSYAAFVTGGTMSFATTFRRILAALAR